MLFPRFRVTLGTISGSLKIFGRVNSETTLTQIMSKLKFRVNTISELNQIYFTRGTGITVSRMDEEVIDYIGSTGAAEIISLIEPVEGTRWGELVEKSQVSHQTVTNRIQEGEELGLIGTETVQGERGTSHVYVLKPKGGFVRYVLESEGVPRTYLLIRSYRKRIQEKISDSQEVLRERGDEFEETKSWNWLGKLQTDEDFELPKEEE